jgi:hypothetical protein
MGDRDMKINTDIFKEEMTKLSTHELSLCLVLAVSFVESNPNFLTFAATQVNIGDLTRKEFAEVSDLFYKLKAIARKAKS